MTDGECPSGGPHHYEYLTAAQQNDDSGRIFYSGWFCVECGHRPLPDA